VASAWLAEIGPAPHEYFATHEKLASWVTLCPGNHMSAGKRKHGRTGDAGTYIKPMLVQAAWSAIKTEGRLQARYHKLVRRFGGPKNPAAAKKAILAIAHTLLNLLQETTAEGTVSYTYDALDRKTAEYSAATGSQAAYASATSPGNEMASWVYDNANNAVTSMKYPIGHETTQTTYSGGQPWVTQQSGFNVFGEPTGEKYTIPATTATTGLSGTYTFGHAWTTNTGLPDGQYYPAVSSAGLPAETTSITYLASALNLAKGISSGIAGYAQTSSYDQWGDVTSEEIGSGTSLADINSGYDQHTLHLDSQDVQRSVGTPADVDQETYNYDLYGNVTSQTSQRLGSPADSETQCYQYDGLDQLTQAWTAASGCGTTPTPSNVTTTVGDGISSASAYWTTWAYDTTGGNAASDVLGEMTSADRHALTAGGTSTTTANTFGGANGGPHALTTAATTGGTTSTSTFKYDAAGNMTTRDVPATGNQALTWNAARQLTSISGGTAGTTSYVYAPDGSLLLQVDPGSTSGSTAATLYLDGEQLTATTSGTTTTVTGARIIALPSGGDVVRTGATTSYYFEIPDPHGTSDLYLDNTAQVPTWRQFTPYGAPRGTTTTWIDNRGFLNKPNDPATGLTYDGARAYDPATGQFTSPDPILNPANPIDLNPYAYAYGNPIDGSDPTGLQTLPCDGQCGTAGNGTANTGDGGSGGSGGTAGSGTGTANTGDGGGGTYAGSGPCFHDNCVGGGGTPAPPAPAVPAAPPRGMAYAPGCNPFIFKLGACPSESGLAGTTPQQVKQSLIGAAWILSSVIPVGDILGALGAGARSLFTAGDFMDSALPSGSEVAHGETYTRIGSDEFSIRVAQNAPPEEGLHDVVAHGDGQDFVVDGLPTNPAQIAEAVRSNPSYLGGPCRILSCFSGQGPAQEFANEMGVDVLAPTSRVGTPRFGPASVILDQGGEWKWFSPEG
jgi:RHS repeat-associated protein